MQILHNPFSETLIFFTLTKAKFPESINIIQDSLLNYAFLSVFILSDNSSWSLTTYNKGWVDRWGYTDPVWTLPVVVTEQGYSAAKFQPTKQRVLTLIKIFSLWERQILHVLFHMQTWEGKNDTGVKQEDFLRVGTAWRGKAKREGKGRGECDRNTWHTCTKAE
jgi:hypothetical protein